MLSAERSTWVRPGDTVHREGNPLLTILIIVVLVLLLTGGIGYGRRGRRG
jgi:p-aminobenzoyl-glutamate transporter AbgT